MIDLCNKCNAKFPIEILCKDASRPKGYKQLCITCRVKDQKVYRQKYKDKLSQRDKEYYIKNSSKIKEKTKIYYHANKPKSRIYKRNYNKVRRQNDALFKLSGNIRHLINIALKKNHWNKTSTLGQSLGCTLEELIIHIENQFESWMTWKNYGPLTWHIDHIIPLSLANTPEEMYKLNHYTNLRPLEAKENIRKGGKYEKM